MKWHEGGGHATRAWWWQEVYKGGVHVLACCVTSPPFYKRMLFLPLTSHCCKDAVSSKPHHRPLRRTRSSFTSVCPSLLRNQRFSQMSTWDKWEPFAAVMVPKNDLKCFSLLSFPVRLFFLLSFRIFQFLKVSFFFCTNTWNTFKGKSGHHHHHRQASESCCHRHALQHVIGKSSQYPSNVGILT